MAANDLAYDALRAVGALFLIWLGVRALVARSHAAPAGHDPTLAVARQRPATSVVWRAGRRGLVNSLANPKLAVFFCALFPQFLGPDAAVLPAALAMAGVIVVLDIVWYGSVALAVHHLRARWRPRLIRRLEQVSGTVLTRSGCGSRPSRAKPAPGAVRTRRACATTNTAASAGAQAASPPSPPGGRKA